MDEDLSGCITIVYCVQTGDADFLGTRMVGRDIRFRLSASLETRCSLPCRTAGRPFRQRRSMTQVGGRLVEGNPKSKAGRRSIPVPQRIAPILAGRLQNRRPGEPAITSPMGARLGLENWKRSVKWKQAIDEIGRPALRVHDLCHTYASLARRAGADLRLLQKTMGHASITVTAHIYADLYDDELDDVASALDALDDRNVDQS